VTIAPHQLEWFSSYFHAMCIRKTGDDWQRFVTDIMSARHPGRFIQVDPSFRGDKGCDGYVDDLMLACYGAARPTSDGTATKMKDDFAKAKLAWGRHMRRWAFVHNNATGLPLAAAEALVALRRTEETESLKLENWPPQVLWTNAVRDLDRADLIALIGTPPSDRPASMTHIAEAVRHMSRSPLVPSPEPASPVPSMKIEFNEFSGSTAALIREYQVHTHLVRFYFARATPGEQFHVAENLRARYFALIATQPSKDAVFHELCDELMTEAFSGTATAATREEQRSAALLLVTHFFESCLIFEAPGESHVPA